MPDAIPYSPSATLSKIAKLLPHIPNYKLCNMAAITMLKSHSHLFKIVTPINMDHLELLLNSHPNQPLIGSVFKGLHEGFFPFTKFNHSASEMWDNSSHVINEDNLAFALQQCND